MQSLRQELDPHLGRTKGVCLPLTLRRQRWRRSESNRHLPRCKRGARPVELHPQEEECGRVESNHHSTRRQGYSLLSSPLLSVRVRVADRVRTGADGAHTRVLPSTPRPPGNGDDRTRTGGLPADNRLLWPLSYVPREWRGWDSNPRSRAHEAREDSRSSTALRAEMRTWIWPAGIEPAVSGSRNRRGGLLPHSQAVDR